MATQTRSNSFRARTRLKSAMSGASFRVLLWPHSTARNRSDLFNIARNDSWQLTQLKTILWPTRNTFWPAVSKHRSGQLKTVASGPQNTAQDRSKPARGNFRTTSGPLQPPQGLQTVKQRSTGLLKTSSGPAQGRSWVSRPQNAVQNRSKPAPSQLETPLSTAQNQLGASSRPAQTSAKLTSARTVHGMHGHTLVW